MYDVLGLIMDKTIKNDSSEVTIIDCCPRLCPKGRTVEFSAVNSARISYGKELKNQSQDIKLINYLIREEHTSPFENIIFTFKIKCPIYTARQIMRHRTFSFNEYSLRYSPALDEMYTPKKFRKQSKINKQSGEKELCSKEIRQEYIESIEISYKTYKKLISMGVCREQARGVLPTCIMTMFYATVSLHNLFKFLKLRMDSDAQREVRDVAESMESLAKSIAPIAFDSWDKYHKNSITLSLCEIEAIKKHKTEMLDSITGNKKYQDKLKKLGIE